MSDGANVADTVHQVGIYARKIPSDDKALICQSQKFVPYETWVC